MDFNFSGRCHNRRISQRRVAVPLPGTSGRSHHAGVPEGRPDESQMPCTGPLPACLRPLRPGKHGVHQRSLPTPALHGAMHLQRPGHGRQDLPTSEKSRPHRLPAICTRPARTFAGDRAQQISGPDLRKLHLQAFTTRPHQPCPPLTHRYWRRHRESLATTAGEGHGNCATHRPRSDVLKSCCGSCLYPCL